MNKKLVLLGTALLLSAASVSAQKRVTGRVLGQSGEPVVGASVRVEGGKGVAVTDANGQFTLQDVSASAKSLKVSYIGKTAKTVSIASNVRVVLEDDDKVLNEAVVMGYGTAQKLGTVVGSVKTIGSEKIENKPTVNALDALQGAVPGLQVLSSSGDPGAALTEISATIRGIGSLQPGANTPLVLIDGVPTSSSIFGTMNPNDIENVTVLKGASATSIYGSRASNGVLFITTKKGVASERAEITIGQSIGWSSLARRIGDPMNATELLDLRREFGLISGEDYMDYRQTGTNTDWQKYNFDDAAPMYQTNFSVRGGSERTNYFTSASLYKQSGLRPGSDFKRITFRTNLNSKPLSWLGYGVNMTVSYDKRRNDSGTENATEYINGGTLSTVMLDPTITPYNEDGSRAWKFDTPFGEFYSPEYEAANFPTSYNDVRAVGSAYLQLTPFRGMTVRSQLSMDAIETRGTSKRNPSTPDYDGYGAASENFGRTATFTITNTAEYKFTLAGAHHVTLLAGQEGIRSNYEYFSASSRGQSNDKITSLGNGLEINGLPTSSEYEYQYLSFFGRADYSYDDKYVLNFSVRNDQSSRFGKNNKSATFLSGGVMWDAKKEYFLGGVTWLNDLKLRADIGTTGNSSIGNYDHLSLLGNGQYGANYAYTLSQIGNEKLKWEKQVQSSIGFDARLFDRITLGFSWYNRDTKDMLMEVPLPYTTGFASRMQNVGKMRNSGIEIEFSADVVKTGDLLVNLHGNYTYNKNEIRELFDNQSQWVYPGMGIINEVGKAVEYYYPLFAGVDKNTGEPTWWKKGHSGDPVHTFNPETMSKEFNEDALAQGTGKKCYAPHSGGFGLTASWKGLSLQADFIYVLGKYMYNNERYFTMAPYAYLGFCNQDRAIKNMWRKPGDETLVPAYGYDMEFDDRLLENASFMRLKNLTIAYELPQQLLTPTRIIKRAKLMLTGRNLFTVTKFNGPDPEIDSNISINAYPNTRQYVVGVEVTF